MQPMPPSDLLNALKPKDRRGSKVRCHLLTHGDDAAVAARLTRLVEPWGRVLSDHVWLPRGFEDTKEARLGETPGLLSPELKEKVSEWWLAVRAHANTPNWDIASACEIEGRSGLLLVEAKAHWNELSSKGKPEPGTPYGLQNHKRIRTTIREANTALNRLLTGWALSRDTHYQLSNRFAWAWKLASLGVPVALIYLGFLSADEMADGGPPFSTAEDWEIAMKAHASPVVPDKAWGRVLTVDGTPLRAVIRAEYVALPG